MNLGNYNGIIIMLMVLSNLINKNKQIKVNDTMASNNTQEYKLLLNKKNIS
jgi:hypothetical protein